MSFAVSFPVLAIAYGIGAISTFLMTVLLGRHVGAAALGTFALANSVARIVYAATDFGAAPYLVRVVARDRSHARPLLGMFASFRACVIALAMVIAFIAASTSSEGDRGVFVLVVLAQGVVSMQIVYEAILQAHDRQPAAAALGVVTSTLVIGVSLTWYFAIGGLLAFTAMYASALGVGIAVWAAWTRRSLGLWPRWRINTDELRTHFGVSWPIGASFLLSNAALRMPILVLGSFTSKADVGTFAAVDMFVTAATILQSAVTNATFPTLAASYRKDPPRFRRTLWLSNALLLAIGLGVALFLVLFGARVAQFAFPGKDFVRMAQLLPIVGWSTPILLLVHHNIFIFAAADHERRNLRFMVLWCAVIGTSQLIFVPALGLIGAAWGQLVGRFVGLVLLIATMLAAGIHRGTD